MSASSVISRLIRLGLIFALALLLTSCGGGLSGTYSSTGAKSSSARFDGAELVSVEFKSFGKAVIETEGLVSRTTYEDGSYKINDNQITLKAEWNINDEWEGTYSFTQEGELIYIDGSEYSKS
ncbi:MAG: hypothetical protein LBS27_04380 [Bifidobacteriaceae bacterium]|nr:hypothetical protein [Bifidobacteriaceae bacterium]